VTDAGATTKPGSEPRGVPSLIGNSASHKGGSGERGCVVRLPRACTGCSTKVWCKEGCGPGWDSRGSSGCCESSAQVRSHGDRGNRYRSTKCRVADCRDGEPEGSICTALPSPLDTSRGGECNNAARRRRLSVSCVAFSVPLSCRTVVFAKVSFCFVRDVLAFGLWLPAFGLTASCAVSLWSPVLRLRQTKALR